jgi:DNA-binding response OmpR family regulator
VRDVPAVLLIEDDAVIARVMVTHLRHAGFEVEWAEDGQRGLRKLRYERPDIAVIDLMLPGLDGWAVTEAIRREQIPVPIIAISARGSEHDKVHTLGIGADDYLAKPFGMRELVARVQALLRRSRSEPVDPRSSPIAVPGLRIDPDLRRAFVATAPDQDVDAWPDAGLTPTEFRLVLTLARQEGRAMTRDELQQRVWGMPYRHRDRTVDVCVRKVREKLDRKSYGWDYVHTHYGVGYRFAAEPHADDDTVDVGEADLDVGDEVGVDDDAGDRSSQPAA